MPNNKKKELKSNIEKILTHKKRHKRLKRGFYKNKLTGHPSYVFKQNNKNVSSLGFTHNKFDFADKEQLKHNINTNDNSPCFVLTKIQRQKDNTYKQKEEYSKYRIHNKDKAIIDKIIKRK